MNTAEGIERFFQPAKAVKPDALGRALESLYPAGCLERIATMTDAEINEYAQRYGVTGAELVAGIFDPGRNADYMKWIEDGEDNAVL